jgi:mono/diheme cytochrome c family protein
MAVLVTVIHMDGRALAFGWSSHDGWDGSRFTDYKYQAGFLLLETQSASLPARRSNGATPMSARSQVGVAPSLRFYNHRRFERKGMKSNQLVRRLSLVVAGCAVALSAAATLLGLLPSTADAQDAAQIARGKYLVAVTGCNDCHTPGYFFGKPDKARYLGGSDVGFAIPGLGVFVAPNLTPDKETGLGTWTTEQIVTAFTAGKTPAGRTLAPIMPWQAFAQLSRPDALAVALYLKTLEPVHHAVPAPFGPTQKVDGVFVMTVLPAEVYNKLPQPSPPQGATEKKQ